MRICYGLLIRETSRNQDGEKLGWSRKGREFLGIASLHPEQLLRMHCPHGADLASSQPCLQTPTPPSALRLGLGSRFQKAT